MTFNAWAFNLNQIAMKAHALNVIDAKHYDDSVLLFEEAVQKIGMVVEGLSTAEAANMIAQKYDAEMPITQCIYHMIEGRVNAQEAVEILMGRKKKNEMHI